MAIDADDKARLARAHTALDRAGEVGRPYIVITGTHLIASGDSHWFEAVLTHALSELETARTDPPEPVLDPTLN